MTITNFKCNYCKNVYAVYFCKDFAKLSPNDGKQSSHTVTYKLYTMHQPHNNHVKFIDNSKNRILWRESKRVRYVYIFLVDDFEQCLSHRNVMLEITHCTFEITLPLFELYTIVLLAQLFNKIRKLIKLFQILLLRFFGKLFWFDLLQQIELYCVRWNN